MKNFIISFLLCFSFILLGTFLPLKIVKAAYNPGYLSSLTMPSQSNYYQCSSSDCTTSKTFNPLSWDDRFTSLWGHSPYVLDGTTSFSANGYGDLITFRTDNALPKNILYSTSVSICHNFTGNATFVTLHAGTSSSSVQSNTLTATNYYTGVITPDQTFEGVQLASSTYVDFTGCTLFRFVWKSSSNVTFFGFRFNTGTTARSNVRIMFMGYNLEVLGPTDGLSGSDIESIINSSGLATASSVNDVKSAINNVRNQITNATNSINSNINDMKGKQDETNNKLDDLNNTINSDEIDTGQASGFFGDFNDTDHGGISGVVTAPLRFVRRITGSCEPLHISLLDADVVLPCGDTLFWDKPTVSSFRTIWNILVGAPIIYLLVLKLFDVIHNLKDPESSKVEVMKL